MAAITSIPENDRRERFVAAGGQTAFPFDFPLYRPEHLAMYRQRGGLETVLTYGADFGVTGAGDQAGGVATLVTPAEAGDIFVVKSNQPIARSTRFVDGGDLPAEGLNAEYNRVFIAFQQIRGALERTIRVPETDPTGLLLPNAAQRADSIFGFDSDGNPVMLQPDISGSGIDRAYVQLLVTSALNRALPRTIVMPYVGSLAEIPEGWELYTPMQDKFIVCAGPSKPHLSTGGASVVNTEPAGAHGHDGQTGEHALTVAEMPPHEHPAEYTIYKEGTFNIGHPFLMLKDNGENEGDGAVEGEGEPHRHPITSAGDHEHEVTVDPPYFALAFIARTGFFVPPPEVGEIPAVTEAALRADMTIACGDETSELEAGTAKVSFRMLRRRLLDGLRITLNGASSSGAVTIDVNVDGATILSTKLTIDQDELTSRTAAVAAVLTAAAIEDDALVTIDVIGAGTGAKGLKIHFMMRYAA